MSNELLSREPSTMPLDQQPDMVRRMWQHEDTIANHRVTWFTTSQGLLFTALTIVLNNHLERLVPTLFALGLGSSVLTLLSMSLGVKAKKVLQIWWSSNCNNYDIPPLCGFYLRPNSLLSYLAPSNLLPVLFGAGWVIVSLEYA